FTDTGVFTKKSCNSNNLDICFSKVKTKGKNTLTFNQMPALIAEVAKAYKADHKLGSDQEAIAKLTEKLAAGKPKAHGATKISA
ncbi:hypothetical protein GH890_31910, partial [Bacillus thuringiensis]|nr:hypothetical protein [Bacillus thuringiensis]